MFLVLVNALFNRITAHKVVSDEYVQTRIVIPFVLQARKQHINIFTKEAKALK